ncbi:dipeptidyl-peptidase 3 family protein [Caulobacter sp. NIBR2454]|uniref:dipeptidyl-peptidase 3 family protein n=1 Tax=Caulobacter sp. NIBR2454 TaxID=3015996 RepID=UPI0022B7315E|nr:hypothetical protein [Caulobacter sp. NIBR2454]
MRRLIALAPLLVLAGTGLTACDRKPDTPPAAASKPATPELAPINMQVNTAFLSAEERQVVNLLIEAADVMTTIYARQSAGDGPGHGFYPAGMTKAEFEAYLAAHPDQKAALTDGYTVVKREGDRLVAVPYSVEYKAELEKAAALLEQAAGVTTNPSLKKFLTLRAQSFRTNDYFASEMAWMDLKDTPIEVAIGPYEVYTDEIMGAKTAFEAFVTLKDPTESSALDKYKAYLPAMEANLPVPDAYKNFKRGGDSPIAVAEQVRGGGDNLHGPQTIAFNLPNDERVREAKGAKKVILSNVLGAKYDRILAPMASRILVADQAALVVKKYMTLGTLFHELAHSLGPGSITVGGRATTVNAELTDIYSASEEAKADVMGALNLLFMMQKNELPTAEKSQLLNTYAAGIFRSVRFGAQEAHGRGAALQFGYLKAKGALVWDAGAGRFRVDEAKMEAGIRDLTADLVRLQATGDRAGMTAFFDQHAKLDDNARKVIVAMGDIPVDIAPIYPSKI